VKDAITGGRKTPRVRGVDQKSERLIARLEGLFECNLS
jgi:hypothetical protein